MRRPGLNRPPIQFASVATANSAHRPIIALDGHRATILTATHFALAEATAVAVIFAFTLARTIWLADLHADAGCYLNSDALSIGSRRGVKRYRRRSAQQDQ